MSLKKFLGGTTAAFLFSAGLAAAQTSTTTVGVPDTGVGGDILNLVLLAVSAAVAIGAAFYLARQRTV